MLRNILNRWFFFNDYRGDHVRALDGLRGIAIIIVLLSHSSVDNMYFHEAFIFLGIGKGGVFLFYALSAYLLDKQISIALRSKQANSFFWKRYFMRRVLRIYPLFIIALIVFWGLTQIGVKAMITDGMDVIRHFFLLEGKGVFWSIPVEFKYYFLSPLILLFCHRYFRWDLRKILILFTLLSMATIAITFYVHLPKISTIKHLTIFLSGTFIAIYEIVKGRPDWINRFEKMLGWTSFIALIIFLMMNLVVMEQYLGITTNNGRKGLIIYTFLSGLMLLGAIYNKGLYKRFLEMKALRYVGVISFSLYLFHMPVVYLLQSGKFDVPDSLRVYFFFGATFLVSTITYLLVERPISRIRISRRKYVEADSA